MDYERIFSNYGFTEVTKVGNQSVGDCLFCQREKKLYVNFENGGWDCKVCGKRGFLQHFLELIVKSFSLGNVPGAALEKDRGIPLDILRAWGIRFDDPDYLIPYKDPKGPGVHSIRTYKLGKKVMAMAGGELGLYGDLSRKGDIYLCEGEWDTMAMDWLLRTLNIKACPIGVPGAGIFKEEWKQYFAGRSVIVCYDNDEAGELGERKIWEALKETASTLAFVRWPDDAPNGFDLRDWVRYGFKLGKPDKCWSALQKLIQPTPRKLRPDEKAATASQEAVLSQGTADPKEVEEAYRRWLHLESVDVLSVLFGSAFANRIEGEPIWMFLVDPPGGGKSEMLMSLSEHPTVYATTSLTPQTLISGASFGGKDPSLIPLLNGKILVIKDFTTIISMHYVQSQEICGSLRDGYDGQTAKNFGTGVRRSYKSRFGILAGVTDKIEMFSTVHASLGERFLRYRITEGEQRVDEETKMLTAILNINNKVRMRQELCSAANRTLNRQMPDEVPVVGPEVVKKIIKLARFVSMLRATVERDRFRDTVQYRPTHEIGTRLALQLSKLGMGMAIYKGRKEVGQEELAILTKVARDTAPERVVNVCRILSGQKTPIGAKEIGVFAHLPQSTIFRILDDLHLLRIVKKDYDGVKTSWSLEKEMVTLIDSAGVFGRKKTPEVPVSGVKKPSRLVLKLS